MKFGDKPIDYFWVFLAALIFFAAIFSIVSFGWVSAIENTCKRECDPYVVQMCNRHFAVCKMPNGYEVRKKKGNF